MRLAALVLVLAAAQEMSIRVEVGLVTVGVRVAERSGREVAGLVLRNFTLYEDGVVQKIESFSNEEQPIALGILLDRSESMSENFKLERAKEAAVALVRAVRPGSAFAYLPFDHEVRGTVGYHTDRLRVEQEISATTLGGGTSLYDAILVGLSRAAGASHARRALVVFSDGSDQHSLHTLEEVVHAVQESQVQLYGIGYFSKEEEAIFHTGPAKISLLNGQQIDNPRVVFQRLAKESGAEAFFPRSDQDLRRTIDRITTDLRTQYTLAYQPSRPLTAGEYRRIEVKVQGGRWRVRARPGYGTRTQPGAPASPAQPEIRSEVEAAAKLDAAGSRARAQGADNPNAPLR
jgi:Ca-activated chloride channel homolog